MFFGVQSRIILKSSFIFLGCLLSFQNFTVCTLGDYNKHFEVGQGTKENSLCYFFSSICYYLWKKRSEYYLVLGNVDEREREKSQEAL